MKKLATGKRLIPNRNMIAGAIFTILILFIWGCMTTPKQLKIKDTSLTFPAGTIINLQNRQTLSFEELSDILEKTRVIYIGENHADPSHHQVQLQIIQALFKRHPDLTVGMEMFDQTYQPILKRWSAGELEQDVFLQKTHWYANWRHRYSLYSDILDFIKEKHIRLIGLNIPFHLPRKISIGGSDSLSPEEKKHLPQHINTTDPDHRAYLKKIFSHHRIPGRTNFEYFYEAQCVWEDVMAEAIARHQSDSPMIILVGNGHIVHKYGVPNRAYNRTQTPFKTIYLASVGTEIDPSVADFAWVTPEQTRRKHPFMK
ncbi:ChaN family lipoprotein [Desulfococcaceae bacterium HSG9]|nr:ChaN family lipoprotein [Desulfococcaceae bacterium HSG9]